MSSMTSHFREPWSLKYRAPSGQAYIVDHDGLDIAVMSRRESDMADARRIVACINALKHISTESLESGLQQNLIARARFAEEWTEELLAVLKPIAAFVERIEHERRNNAS